MTGASESAEDSDQDGALKALLAQRDLVIQQRDTEIKNYKTEILYLKEKNARLLHSLYGRSSERRVPESATGVLQLSLALSEVGEESKDSPNATGKSTPVSGHTREVGKRKRLEGELSEGKFPEHLPRVVKVLDEGTGEIIATKITERLCVSPSQFYVEETRRVVRKQEDGAISQPPVPVTPLPRRCVDATFLVHIIIMKFLWHLPLYRQEQMLKAQGIDISRDTLIRYVIDVSLLIKKLYRVHLESVFADSNLYADETPVLVGKKRGPNDSTEFTESRFWPFLSKDAIVFIFARTRAAKEIEPYRKGYKGHLQVDGYTVYESIAKRFPEIVLVFCWAHVRRHFVEAELSYPTEAKQALRYIRALYDVEARAKGKDSSTITRLRARFSVKILKLFKQWLDVQFKDPRLLPKSDLGRAIGYVLPRWEGLCRYARDPALSIDSNPVERQQRGVALGRKNWLFCASETGAEAACMLYSLIASCKLAGVDPYAYLVDVLNRINDHNQLQLHELLPKNWKPLKTAVDPPLQEQQSHSAAAPPDS